MDESEIQFFFECLNFSCRFQNYKIELFGTQFDEISNIKKRTKFGEDANKRSRTAIDRIDFFQKSKLLNISDISIDAEPTAYADPLIVKILCQQSRQGKECTLLSEDKELRIRVRQKFQDYSEAKWNIIEIEKHIDLFDNIAESIIHMTNAIKDAIKSVEAK